MKQLTQVLRTLLMKLLRRSMLLLHVMVLINANATNALPELVPSREKELMDQIASLKSSVEKLSRGEYIHKEILFNNARDYGKRGLGSFPEPNQGTTPSPEIKTSFIK